MVYWYIDGNWRAVSAEELRAVVDRCAAELRAQKEERRSDDDS